MTCFHKPKYCICPFFKYICPIYVILIKLTGKKPSKSNIIQGVHVAIYLKGKEIGLECEIDIQIEKYSPYELDCIQFLIDNLKIK